MRVRCGKWPAEIEVYGSLHGLERRFGYRRMLIATPPSAASRAFGYGRRATLTMWAMTMPQVAATLAAAMVGYDTFNAAGERLLAEEIFNANLVLLVVTSLLGPVLTELFTPGMITAEDSRTKIASARASCPRGFPPSSY